jgi:Lar family restriction alleviation protein
MKNKLLPCPFCGGEAYIWHAVHQSYGLKVSCRNDCVTIPSSFDTWYTSEEQAIKSWNRRIGNDETETVIDQIQS